MPFIRDPGVLVAPDRLEIVHRETYNAQNSAAGQDITTVQNKVAVATYFSDRCGRRST
jgi:hypothetical protein